MTTFSDHLDFLATILDNWPVGIWAGLGGASVVLAARTGVRR